MIKTYTVSGMTCNGCRAGVETKLREVAGVSAVSVDLEKAEATIETEQPIPLAVFQDALPGKYSIAEKVVAMPFEQEISVSEWRQLFPLFLIFLYITTASVLLNVHPWSGHSFMLDFMGLFYIVFSFFKMLDLKGFPDSFRMYDPLASKVPVYAILYPFIETVLGLLFLMRLEINIALWITVVTLGVTTIGVVKTLMSNKSIQCACLGTALKLPMTKATLIENSVMLVMAILMLVRVG